MANTSRVIAVSEYDRRHHTQKRRERSDRYCDDMARSSSVSPPRRVTERKSVSEQGEMCVGCSKEGEKRGLGNQGIKGSQWVLVGSGASRYPNLSMPIGISDHAPQ